MNPMPKRIWASNLFDSWVSSLEDAWNGENTEYIRADIVKEQNAMLVNALQWYEKRASLCRKISHEGDIARRELDRDGGFIAQEAIARAESAEGGG